jgi:hypothetical protein
MTHGAQLAVADYHAVDTGAISSPPFAFGQRPHKQVTKLTLAAALWLRLAALIGVVRRAAASPLVCLRRRRAAPPHHCPPLPGASCTAGYNKLSCGCAQPQHMLLHTSTVESAKNTSIICCIYLCSRGFTHPWHDL